MRKICILVIASTNLPIYKLFLQNFWIPLISTMNQTQEMDIFLLFDNQKQVDEVSELSLLRNNIIINKNIYHNGFVVPENSRICSNFIPGILSKTIYGLETLQSQYEVYFRTNLSSMIHVPNFLQYVNSNKICYSCGSQIVNNTLRQNISQFKKFSAPYLKNMSELDSFHSNSFCSGCGYFLNKNELNYILQNKKKIRYDIIDDVAIGLLFDKKPTGIPNFSIQLVSNMSTDEMNKQLQKYYCHIRVDRRSFEKNLDSQTAQELAKRQLLVDTEGIILPPSALQQKITYTDIDEAKRVLNFVWTQIFKNGNGGM